MIPAWDYGQVCRRLGNAFRYRYTEGEVRSIRMVGLLFAPERPRLARDEIVLSLDYSHHRSGNHIDFLCAGYGRYGLAPAQRLATNDNPPWMFSLDADHRFQQQIERLSLWRYSGEVDLLLMNGNRGSDDRIASLAFSSAIVCDLDRTISDGAIRSTRRFFEDIFRFVLRN